MKKYQRSRTLKELRAECKKSKWILHTKRYKEGSDFVSVDFKTTDGTKGTFLFSMFNGRLFGETNTGVRFGSNNDKHDNEAWFIEVLNSVYIAAA